MNNTELRRRLILLKGLQDTLNLERLSRPNSIALLNLITTIIHEYELLMKEEDEMPEEHMNAAFIPQELPAEQPETTPIDDERRHSTDLIYAQLDAQDDELGIEEYLFPGHFNSDDDDENS